MTPSYFKLHEFYENLLPFDRFMSGADEFPVRRYGFGIGSILRMGALEFDEVE